MKQWFFIVLGLVFFLPPTIAQNTYSRQPAVAGAFYPADPGTLSAQIDEFFKHAKEVAAGDEIYGLVAPHAGYVYSGIVAAQSYKQLFGRNYEDIIVISPSHVEYFPFSSVMEKGTYATPLGQVAIDEALARKIARGRKTVKLSRRGHFQSHLQRQEHALEVQLPFLQRVFKKFKLVAIVMGDQSWACCTELADAIYQATRGRKVLIVASSDMSHFHPYQEARRIDGDCISLIESYDYTTLHRQLQTRRVEACGGGPIVTMMMAARKKGAQQMKILMYANSGDTAGNRSSVVGYLAAIAIKPNHIKKVDQKMTGIYSPEERKELLWIARCTIENCVCGKEPPEFTVHSEKLKEKRGAFVTINKFGQLRGCIGYTQPVFPLYQTVQQVAKAAALEDPRFPPVEESELDHLELEISVLTLPKKIKDINEIQVGKHGLIVKQGYFQGLLLPQVATEYHWDRITFLQQTCRKAGLPQDAWKSPNTEIYIFSAEVFSDH